MVAPAATAATYPAPCDIPPCVIVGPSSTTITRRPRTAAGSSSRTGEAARTIAAVGFTACASSTTAWTSAASAASTLVSEAG
jgi:hypothetical protein